jgi:ribosomal protein RSM22 (predicted rRNA methylase)
LTESTDDPRQNQKDREKEKEKFKVDIVTYGPRESLAYLLTRMPNAYAACETVFSELQRRMPDFAPQSILDYGTGPGTAIWAAREQWSESLQKHIGVDTSEAMLEMLKNVSSKICLSALSQMHSTHCITRNLHS